MSEHADLSPAVERLRRLDTASTAGPWETRFMHRVFVSARQDKRLLFSAPAEQDWTDCDLIAEMRNALPSLLHAAEQWAKVQAMKEKIENGVYYKEMADLGSDDPAAVVLYCGLCGRLDNTDHAESSCSAATCQQLLALLNAHPPVAGKDTP